MTVVHVHMIALRAVPSAEDPSVVSDVSFCGELSGEMTDDRDAVTCPGCLDKIGPQELVEELVEAAVMFAAELEAAAVNLPGQKPRPCPAWCTGDHDAEDIRCSSHWSRRHIGFPMRPVISGAEVPVLPIKIVQYDSLVVGGEWGSGHPQLVLTVGEHNLTMSTVGDAEAVMELLGMGAAPHVMGQLEDASLMAWPDQEGQR